MLETRVVDPPQMQKLVKAEMLNKPHNFADVVVKAPQSTWPGRQIRRFPKYGTHEFSQQCGWTAVSKQGPHCAFFVRPRPNEFEGVSRWISQIVVGYLLAKQANCKVLFDYGKDINILEVLTPATNLGPSLDDQLNNWTVPSGFKCENRNLCFQISNGMVAKSYMSDSDFLAFAGSTLGRDPLVPVPWYRYAYRYQQNRSVFRDLELVLPGFQLESGMACSLGNLFHLAPSASQFEPQLFRMILPTLQDEEALVMTIYIRTTVTDKKAQRERAGQAAESDLFAEEDKLKGRNIERNYLQCAFHLEDQYLSGSLELGINISRVVWMLVTDSTYLKQRIIDSYSTQDANSRLPTDRQKWKSRVIPREVLGTRSRGMHTRTGRNPSTADFAEALIDWYLIGESDLVIMSERFSFGATGALRTARPIYDVKSCSRAVLYSS